MNNLISAQSARFNFSLERNPGYALLFHQALKGRYNRWPAFSGLMIFLNIRPKALPWVIVNRLFGAWEQHAESAKLEQAIKANLKGLGYGL
jgi:hypothetical protein